MPHRDNIASLATDLFNNFEDRCKGTVIQRNRIVAIVGAGASFSAGLPLGAKLKQNLFDEITNSNTGLLTRKGALLECGHFWRRKDFDFSDPCPKELDDLNLASVSVANLEQHIIASNNFDLLAFCQALSGYRAVRNLIDDHIIKALNPAVPSPVLTYELLAHLLHHRFIDHIISMNFDTLLDDSLQDELGRDSINMVLSDRDIPSLRSAAEIESRKPWYLKPHGSVTLPDSLRYTLTQTSGLSRSMMELVKHVLFGVTNEPDFLIGPGSWSYSDKIANQPRLILLFVGWACREQTFRRLLRDKAPLIDKIYWFHRASPDSKELDLGSTLQPKIRGISCVVDNKRLSGLDANFLNIYGSFPRTSLSSSINIPPISRHLLYCYAMSGKPTKHTSSIAARQDTARAKCDRLKFELFYYSLKSKGSFSTQNMSQISRIQNSFNRFKQLGDNDPASLTWSAGRDIVQDCFDGEIKKELQREAYALESYLYVPSGSDGMSNSLKRLLDFFWSKKSSDSNDFLTFQGPSRKESEFAVQVKKYFQSRNCTETWEKKLAELLAHHLDITRRMPEVEVNNHPSAELTWLFQKPKEICSIAELQYRTVELLKEPDWNTLKVITEAGAWLLSDDIRECLKNRGIQLQIILSESEVPLSANHQKELQMAFPSARIYKLPWWLHNRHMTLSSDKKRAGEEFKRGLYFRRRLKSGLINPVEIHMSEDLDMMNNLFVRYLKKCSDWNKNAH